MPPLTIEQVAQVAWEAGFRGDALVIAVAVARGESGLRSDAAGDEALADDKWGPSIGLFQVRSLREQTGTGEARDIEQLTDPRFNARAAWEISNGGTNFKPWSVFNHDRHLQFLDETRSVVRELETRGAFESGEIDVPGAGPLATGVGAPGDLAGSDVLVDEVVPTPTASPEDLRLQAFLDAALAQRGDIYDFDRANAFDRSNANLLDDNPEYFDCSELVQWAAVRAGVDFVDGSWNQYRVAANAGHDLTVDEALRTPGALLFKFSSDPMQRGRPDRAHVAISLGDGQVMEASSPSRGVNVFNAEGRGWTHAATIPGLGTTLPTVETISIEEIPYERDSDMDGLRDQLELFISTDPFGTDTDRDGFADIDELVSFDTDPLDYVSSPLGVDRPNPEWRPPLTTADELADPPPAEPRLTTPPSTPPDTPPSPPSDGAETPPAEPADVPEAPSDGESPEVPAGAEEEPAEAGEGETEDASAGTEDQPDEPDDDGPDSGQPDEPGDGGPDSEQPDEPGDGGPDDEPPDSEDAPSGSDGAPAGEPAEGDAGSSAPALVEDTAGTPGTSSDEEVAELRHFVAERLGVSPGGSDIGSTADPTEQAVPDLRSIVTDRLGIDASQLDSEEIERFVAPDHDQYLTLKVDYPTLPDTLDEFDEMFGD